MPTDAELLAAALDPYQQQADPTLLAALANPAAPDVPRQSSYLAELGAAPTVQSTGGLVQAVTPAGQALVGGVADTLMAPGRAFTGEMAVRDPETGHMTQDATDWGAGTALGMLGGSSVPRAPIAGPGETALGMFAGRTAKTADLGAFSQAEKLAGSGAPREQIWNETGWFQGPDQQWRFEIPDNASKVGTAAADGFIDGKPITGPVAGALWHKDLYAAYPDLRRVQTNIERGGDFPQTWGGSFDGSTVAGRAGTTYDARQLLLHELQHGVQDIEGFAKGGNPAYSNGAPRHVQFQAARDAYEAADGDAALLRELGIDVPATAQKPWDQLTPREQVGWLEQGREGIYRRLAGETEARNVTTRRDLTPEQRRATPPWATQDVPDAQQIVRMGTSDGPQMSVLGSGPIRAYHGSPHDFDAFDLSKAGSTTDPGALGRGVYFSDDPRVAASAAHRYEVEINAQNPLTLQDQTMRGRKVDIVSDALGLKAPTTRDEMPAWSQQVADMAQQRGHDAIVLDYSPSGYNAREIAALDPSIIQIMRKYGVSSLAALPPGVLATMGLGSDGQPDTRPQT